MMREQPHDTPSHGRRFVLVLGGARSGKSSYAEALAARVAGHRPVLYVATAMVAGDEEMGERIAVHQRNRPPGWTTIEAPLDPGAAIQECPRAHDAAVVLIDCVTLLVANAVLAGADVDADGMPLDVADAEVRARGAISGLLAAYHAGSASYIVVTNEVGMGLVPPYPLGRVYRDLLGRLNALLAEQSDAVVLLVAGIPVELKAIAQTWEIETRRLFDLEGSA